MLNSNLISQRYANDGVSLLPLNNIQKKAIDKFLNDNRIKYRVIENCWLCKSTNFTLIARKDRYGIPLDTVVCDNCGLILSLKQLTYDSLEIFYTEYYRKIYDGKDNINFQSLELKYERHYKKVKLLSFVNTNKTVVELGCGGGWNLMPFMRENIKHYGFDYDDDYIKLGKSKNLNLYKGGLDTARQMNIQADYLLLSHILEHTDNPLDFLRNIKQILKPNAIININIPSRNILLFGGGGTGYDLLGTLQNSHNYLFDSQTIKFTALLAGYEILINIGGGNIVLKNTIPKKPDNFDYSKILNLSRGGSIINFLKLIEFILPVKIKTRISDNIWYKIFRFCHLRDSLKKIYYFKIKTEL